MIGTLTRYELKKSVWNKFFLIIFALLLLANVLLNCGIQDFLNWMDLSLIHISEPTRH